MLIRRFALALLTLFGTSFQACADSDEKSESRQWQEAEFQLPPAPQPENLLPFYVSAVTTNRFFIDGSTLSVGADGVVRYVLVVLSPEGGRNVTFEGMRCQTRERRIYASGRTDGAWSKSRRQEWVVIQDAVANRHHAVLFFEYFCPAGSIVRDADEARHWLVRGGYLDSRR